jgi:hypothetical protein
VLADARRHQDPETQTLALDALARTAAGDPARAARLLEEADRLHALVRHALDDADRLDALAARAAL